MYSGKARVGSPESATVVIKENDHRLYFRGRVRRAAVLSGIRFHFIGTIIFTVGLTAIIYRLWTALLYFIFVFASHVSALKNNSNFVLTAFSVWHFCIILKLYQMNYMYWRGIILIQCILQASPI